MRRIYESIIEEHFLRDRQMLFLSGPRQVGKTTTAKVCAPRLGATTYLDWDNTDHRRLILAGPGAIASKLGLDRLQQRPPVCVLDEIHKHPRWKTLLKGLFDTYGDRARFLVTGSARLDFYRRGGDSLMGRYFAYRMHPLSLGELAYPSQLPSGLWHPPREVEIEAYEALLKFGGFPEPLLRVDKRFWNRWQRSREERLVREDLRDLTQVRELGLVELLAQLLRERSGQLVNYTKLARDLDASVGSIKRWVGILESVHHCFVVSPWFENVARALRKQPKVYLWDWSTIGDPGARNETFVAGALLKAVHFWTDRGDGRFELRFLRDKDKREVDFVVTRDRRPWFLVEVKSSFQAPLSPNLGYFQKQTGAVHAFQVAVDAPYVDRDCFEHTEPIIVPARTLLSQLI